ncbi:protein kinase [Pleurocapsales cyanobacterium LEGE 10410]|nr:protein kinase [Pleurocapsales cyanobacterium LEGE 10410]
MDNNLVGQTIQGRYYVVRRLGRGGVGVTFLAQDRQCFDSPCVVKQLKPRSANPKTLKIARKLFNREAEIMNRLGHCDRIPRLLAYFEQDRDFFLVQELIEGHELSKEIVAGQPWSENKTIALLQEVLEVLLLVQQQRVVHRDLKPSNLMRRHQDNKIVLIDFGSVKLVSTQVVDIAGIKKTIAVGTKYYMPIEQKMGHPGFYSDIYALGIIAIQALTGKHPREFAIDSNGEIIWRNLLDSQVDYQPLLLDILDKMVHYRYQERYAATGAVLSDLKRLDKHRNNQQTAVIPQEIAPSDTVYQPLSENLGVIDNQTKFKPSTATAEFIESNQTQPQTQLNNQFKFKIFPAIVGMFMFATVVSFWLFISKSSESEIQLSSYENSSQGFELNYPEVWSKQKRDDFFTSGTVFLSPLENDSDKFKERVSVLVEDLSGSMSLAQYTAESIAEIKRLSDPNVGEAQTVKLGDRPGQQVIYEGEEHGSSIQRMQTWSVEGDRAYIITYTAQPQSYNKYLPIVERMIESFKILTN